MKDSKLLREFIRESISSKSKIDEGFFSDIGDKISNFLGFGDNEDPIDKQKESQALGEFIPLSKVLELDKDKRALIIGSEQVKSIGRYVKDMLASKGFSNIDFVTKHFSSMSDVTSHVQGSINSSKNDIAIIFAGFKQGSDANDTIELVNLFKKGTCFVVAPPPVTLITDLDKASRIGLGEPTSISDDYWFRLKTKSGQNYCDEREDFVTELARVVSATGGTLLNPRDMGLGGEHQPTGLSFPSSPDGIYPSPSTSQQIASNIIDEIFSSQAQVKVSDVMANISKEDIEKPGFLDTLRELPGFGMLFSLFDNEKEDATKKEETKEHANIEFSQDAISSPEADQFLEKVAQNLPADFPLHITSVFRSSRQQADAMFTKWIQGGDAEIQKTYGQGITVEVRAIIDSRREQGKNESQISTDETIIDDIESMIDNMRSSGTGFLRSHMIGLSVDFRTKNITDDQLEELEAACLKAGSGMPVRETNPKHLHVPIYMA